MSATLEESVETRDEMESRHRKELKQLDGEKRAAIKKAKSTKGKKAKDELIRTEAEYEAKLVEMQQRHADESSATAASTEIDTTATVERTPTPIDDAVSATSSKLERLRLKKEAERAATLAQERALQHELATVGPTRRDVELQQIMTVIQPLGYTIEHVTADGHCLYRAIAGQHSIDAASFATIRSLCADTLAAHPTDFAPFCEYDDDQVGSDVDKFAAYVQAVRSSSQWGGHLELRALSLALNRPIVIYSADTIEPLVIDARPSPDEANTAPIRLSYHLHYYALGEHYNMVVAGGSSSTV